MLVRDADDLIERLQHTRRGLRVHQAHDTGSGAGEGRVNQSLLDALWRHRGAPGCLDQDRLAARATDHLGHPGAEIPGHADDGAVARLHEVRDGRLHPRRSGPRDRECPVVACPENLAQHDPHIIHDREKDRVEVTEQRVRHRRQHEWIDRGGAGPQKDPGRRVKRRKGGRHEERII